MMNLQVSSKLHIDIETYSSVSLAKCGVYKYAESEDFEILLFAFSFDGEPVTVIDLARGQALPPKVKKALFDPSVCKVAHNAAFERVCLSRYFQTILDPEQWECTMVRTLSLGLPASLDEAGKALGFSEDRQKMKEGKALIREFCTPDKNGHRTRPQDDPENWEVFIEYNRQDVVTEMEIAKTLEPYPRAKGEHDLYVMDQKINDHGILVDNILIDTVLNYNASYRSRLTQDCLTLCGIEPTRVKALKSWIEANEGIELPGLTKQSTAGLLASNIKPDTRQVIEIRQEAGKSSVSKYEVFSRCTCLDGRIHGAFQFCGAGRTGRWSGRLIQPQNFPRSDFDDVDLARSLVIQGRIDDAALLYPSLAGVFSTLVRTLVKAPKLFAIADYSAIEARVIAWIAGEEWRLETFKNGGDIYCESASKMFKVPVEKHGVNGHLRQKGKIAELALGYGGGVNALLAFDADKMGLSRPEMESIVAKWREASPKIVSLWKEVGDAAMQAVRNYEHVRCRGGIEFFMQDRILFMRIPSGRFLAYYRPRIEPDENGWNRLCYDSQKKAGLSDSTWGGKLVENAVQATARDCLAWSMMRISKKYPIVMHIHDEVVVEVPDKSCLAEIEDMMSNRPGHCLDWCPDLLLSADGFVSPYYRKE